MSNNRRRTKGRIVQVVTVPKYKGIDHNTGMLIPNLHPNAGKTVQIRHQRYSTEA